MRVRLRLHSTGVSLFFSPLCFSSTLLLRLFGEKCENGGGNGVDRKSDVPTLLSLPPVRGKLKLTEVAEVCFP